MLAGALTLMGFSKSDATDSVTSHYLILHTYFCFCLHSEVLLRSEVGMHWWRDISPPFPRSVSPTRPAASLEMTLFTYSETRCTLTCPGLVSSSACPSPPCGIGVLIRYCNKFIFELIQSHTKSFICLFIYRYNHDANSCVLAMYFIILSDIPTSSIIIENDFSKSTIVFSLPKQKLYCFKYNCRYLGCVSTIFVHPEWKCCQFFSKKYLKFVENLIKSCYVLALALSFDTWICCQLKAYLCVFKQMIQSTQSWIMNTFALSVK